MKECKGINKNFQLTIDGLGIVIYSNQAMNYIQEGEDYFSKEFATPEKVANHIKKGDIIGFNTGSSGKYNIKVRYGYPDKNILDDYPVAIRLALDVKGNEVSFIDLYWLMEWSDFVPDEQKIMVHEGIYHVTVLTRKPSSGIWGDNQEIYFYMNKIDEMPELQWDGVPLLFTE